MPNLFERLLLDAGGIIGVMLLLALFVGFLKIIIVDWYHSASYPSLMQQIHCQNPANSRQGIETHLRSPGT